MPTPLRTILACLAIALPVALIEGAAVHGAERGGPPTLRPDTVARASLQQTPSCSANVDKTAAPGQVRLGQPVTITLKVDGSCPVQEQPAEVILAIDHSTSMDSENKLQAAKDAAVTFVNRIDPALVRLGVVSVAGTADKLMDLTTDRAAVIQTIQGLNSERGTNIVDGLESARRALIGANVRPGAKRVIIFLTDGRHRATRPISDLDPIILSIRTLGIEVFSIGLGSDADTVTLQRMATDASHYYFSPGNAELEGIYLQIAGRIQAQVLYRTATITDVLPDNMVYVPGTARPSEPRLSADRRTLTWQLVDVAPPGLTIRYQVRPTEVGTWPTNARAALSFVDGFGQAGERVFPVPTVRVIDETPSGAKCICRIIYERVPQSLIDEALAHPERFHGWQYPLNPNKPRGPDNPPRQCLTLTNVNIDFHPIFNTPEWRVGCP